MKLSVSRPIGSLLGAAWMCAAGLLAGCASTSPAVNDDDAPVSASGTDSGVSAIGQVLSVLPEDALKNRSLAAQTGSTPGFYADTPERRIYGMLGVIAMLRAGNQLVQEYGLEDPAAQLSEDLVASLAIQNRMQTSTPDAADLLLDVKTINWDFRPYRNDPDSLFVVYSARVSLIDQRNKTVLASGKCRSRRDSEGDSATLEQLLADGAERLHKELREAAQECAQRMKSETLSAFLQTVAPVAQRFTATQPAGALR